MLQAELMQAMQLMLNAFTPMEGSSERELVHQSLMLIISPTEDQANQAAY